MSRLRVFILEDDPDYSEALCALLAAAGEIEVVGWSPRVDRGVREIERLGPDLVLLDMHLAEGSGFDVLRALRSGRGRPSVKVYAITSDWSRNLRTACRAAGADDCFDKAESAGLVDRIKRLVPSSSRAAPRRGLQQIF